MDAGHEDRWLKGVKRSMFSHLAWFGSPNFHSKDKITVQVQSEVKEVRQEIW